MKKKNEGFRLPKLRVALVPVAWLLCFILCSILIYGPDAALGAGKWAMLSASVVALVLSRGVCHQPWRYVGMGLGRSWRQLYPAICVLFFIAMVSASWMLSGIVPTFIHYGLLLLQPNLFLVTAALVCAVVSVFTGSSWTTIATIGVALLGVGTVFGYEPGWIAGAIISGAYFGDKVSPLSDTTVLASASCGVPLLRHVRFLMYTSVPALLVALAVFLLRGLLGSSLEAEASADILQSLNATFHITPLLLLIPLLTFVLILLRVGTNLTLAASTLMGCIAMGVAQPQLIDGGGDIIRVLLVGASPETGNAMLDSLTETGGIRGIRETIFLVCSSVVFGGTLMGTGMLQTITNAITRHLRGVRRTVGATVGTGLFLNAFTADQYLSIIIGCNIYKGIYRRQHFDPRLLSRTVEDSTSVTSVLIPWNSCGMTQSTVLGVATLTYLPFCVFNWMSPLMSLLWAHYLDKDFRRKAALRGPLYKVIESNK